ncbi:exocyst complex component 7-like [Liolophura sinensis]|uniref:exocyst complex component 7-like n=1 Tax=Liolophura sinensis TaxID=3198878 RepID=UPI0031598CC8
MDDSADIAVLKAEIDAKLDKEVTNLNLMKDTLYKSSNTTQNMLTILSSFESRLKRLNDNIVPLYQETDNLRRRQENIEKTMGALDNVLSYYHVAKEVEDAIRDGPTTCGLDKYLLLMNRLLKAKNYFTENSPGSPELSGVSLLFDEGKDNIQQEFKSTLSRHGRPVRPMIILNLLGGDDDIVSQGSHDSDNTVLEHFPEKEMGELGEMARWLVTDGNTTDFLKVYSASRSSILQQSLQGLKDHLKSSSLGSASFHIQSSPATSGKLRTAKETPTRKSIKRTLFMNKASKALIKSPFEAGNKRQISASLETTREETWSDVELEFYITQLTALLKLIQSEAQLMTNIIPEKHQRTVLDDTIQQAMEMVISEGELIAVNVRKAMGRHEYTSVLNVFPIIRHIRSIKSDFDLTLEGLNTNTRTKLTSLLSSLDTTGAKGLDAFVDSIKADPERASNMPKDGTVHELTNHVMIFLEQLLEYADAAGVMLLRHDDPAGTSMGADPEKAKKKIADYVMKVLSSLGLNLTNKAETYGDATLRAIFMLNNYNYMLKSLKRSGLLELVHIADNQVEQAFNDKILENKKLYSESWSRVLHYILEVHKPISVQRTSSPDVANLKLKDKDKQNIKDKFTGFNKELEDICRIQKSYAIPDSDLRQTLIRDNKDYITPKYKMFRDKYTAVNFTKNPDKYVKYTVDQVSRLLDTFFDATA